MVRIIVWRSAADIPEAALTSSAEGPGGWVDGADGRADVAPGVSMAAGAAGAGMVLASASALADGFTVAEMKPPTFFPEEIIAHGKTAGVDRIVLVQMSFYRNDNRYMLDVMREYDGVFSGIAIVDPERPWVIQSAKMEASAGNTPFDGQPTQGRVTRLFKGGVAIKR